MKHLLAIAICVVTLVSAVGCAHCPVPGKCGEVVTPFTYTPAATGDREGMIRVSFDRATARWATEWRLADEDGPRPAWQKVQREENAAAVKEPAATYLLQFRAVGAIAPESRTITLVEKQQLNVMIRYK